MRSERSRIFLAAAGFAAVAALVSGCGDAGSGAAASEPTDAAAPATPTPTVAIPPRPREVTVEGVDPCAIFTREQLRELKVAREPRVPTDTNRVPELQGPQCAFSIEDDGKYYDYAVHLLMTEGIEPWLTGKRNADAHLVSVGGFPAVSFYIRGGGKGSFGFACYTSVGVAEGQQLYVTMQALSKAFSQEQLCAMSERAAGLALQTLQTMK